MWRSSRRAASWAATWCPTAGPKPQRVHIRAPSFVNLQSLPHLMYGGLLADAIAIISSIDPIMGEVDR